MDYILPFAVGDEVAINGVAYKVTGAGQNRDQTGYIEFTSILSGKDSQPARVTLYCATVLHRDTSIKEAVFLLAARQ